MLQKGMRSKHWTTTFAATGLDSKKKRAGAVKGSTMFTSKFLIPFHYLRKSF